MSSHLRLPGTLRQQLANREEQAMFDRWRQEEASSVHPGFAEGELGYDPQQSALVPRKAKHDLQEIVHACLEGSAARQSGLAKFNLDAIVEKAQAAEDEYNRQESKKKVRGWTRKQGTDLARNLEVWTKLFPDEYGLSILGGAFDVLFNAVTKVSENREAIFKFFHEAPDIILNAEMQAHAFPKDKRLASLVDELNETIITALTDLLCILQPSKKRSVLQRLNLSKEGSRRLHSFVSVESTGYHITLICQTVYDSKVRVDEYLNSLKTHMLLDTNKSSSQGLLETRHMRLTAHEIKSGQHEIRREVTDGMLGMRDQLTNIQQQQTEQNQNFLLAAQFATQLPNNLFRMIQDAYRNGMIEAMNTPRLLPAARSPIVPSVLPEEIIEVVGVPPGVEGKEVLQVLQKHNTFTPDSMNQASRLLTHSTFEAWLGGRSPAQSRCLLVDGFAREIHGKISPISVVSAMVASFLFNVGKADVVDDTGVIVLPFFCALNSFTNEDIAGPSGMLRRLISRLILSLPKAELDVLNLSFIEETPDLRGDLERHETGALCHVFCEIVRRIRWSIKIVCIIDDVARFETDECNWKGDMHQVVSELKNLIRERQQHEWIQVRQGVHPSGATLRLLLTSAYKSTDICSLFSDDPQSHISLRSVGTGPSIGNPMTGLGVRDALEGLMPSSSPSTSIAPSRASPMPAGDHQFGMEAGSYGTWPPTS